MTVLFKPVSKRNPSQPEGAAKYYAQVVSSGDISLRALAKQISAISTVSTVDTVAVLEAFLQLVPETLADGRIVRLGEFGSFSLTARGEGAETPEALNAGYVKQVNVRFRPGTEFRKAMLKVTLSKES